MESTALYTKLPFLKDAAGYILPVSLSQEQASSQATAEYKTSIIRSLCSNCDTIIDMTGGMGIDTTFFSKVFRRCIYIERNETLCSLATNNFKVIGAENVEIINGDSVQYVEKTDKVSVIYADPARRSHNGGKMVSIADCEPNLLTIIDTMLSRCDILLVKLSPMLDINVAIKELKRVSHLFIVSLNGECKELLAICSNKAEQPIIHCVNLPSVKEFTFTVDEEHDATTLLSMPQKYLYEPDASILKAGAFKTICHRYGVRKLHINSHLYTSEQFIEEFPGRTFEIVNIRKVHKEHFKEIDKANITTRNFPTSVAEIRKKLGIKDGGDIYMFATTLSDNNKRMIICKKSNGISN